MRRATCSTARSSETLIALAAEHRVDALAQPALVGELEQQAHRLVGDAVLRVVEVQARRLEANRSARRGIAREQLAQVAAAELRWCRSSAFQAGRSRGDALTPSPLPRVVRPFS